MVPADIPSAQGGAGALLLSSSGFSVALARLSLPIIRGHAVIILQTISEAWREAGILEVVAF